MTDPEPASSPCQAPPGYWGEDEEARPAEPAPAPPRPGDDGRPAPTSLE